VETMKEMQYWNRRAFEELKKLEAKNKRDQSFASNEGRSPLKSTQPFGIIQSSTPDFSQSSLAFGRNLFPYGTSTPVFGEGTFGQPTQQNRIAANPVTSKFD